MATEKQQELFARLVGQKDIGDNDPEKLKQQFASLPDKSASAWIEKLLEKPDAGSVPPPF